jgi:invasion protein IalB
MGRWAFDSPSQEKRQEHFRTTSLSQEFIGLTMLPLSVLIPPCFTLTIDSARTKT